MDALAWHPVAIAAIATENHRTRSLTLDVSGWPGHRPGQHVDVRLTAEDGYQAQRSYSIASAPEEPGLRLTVELVEDGEVSGYLVQDARVGDAFDVRGPIGRPFSWTVADGGPLLLLGGGSGLVPLMAMLRHRAARRAADVEAHALVSVRGAADALFAAELAAMSSDVDVLVTHTREPAPPGGTHGRIDAAMLARVDPGAAAAPMVFVCGPTGFVEAAAALLLDAGHPAGRIATERFGPS